MITFFFFIFRILLLVPLLSFFSCTVLFMFLCVLFSLLLFVFLFFFFNPFINFISYQYFSVLSRLYLALWRCFAGLLCCRTVAKWSLRYTYRGVTGTSGLVWKTTEFLGLDSSWSGSLWNEEFGSSCGSGWRGSEGASFSSWIAEGLSGNSPAPRNPAWMCSAVNALYQSLANNLAKFRFSTLAAFV